LYILQPGVIRLPGPKLSSDVSLIVFESPRHIRQQRIKSNLCDVKIFHAQILLAQSFG